MKSFIRYFLLSGLLAWSLGTGADAIAQDCPSLDGPDLVTQAEEYVKKGDFLTSAAHNPRVKDYYQASDMYAKAATLYEHGSYQYRDAIKACSDQTGQFQTMQDDLSAKAKKYIFKSYQTNHVGANRDSRGLL